MNEKLLLCKLQHDINRLSSQEYKQFLQLRRTIIAKEMPNEINAAWNYRSYNVLSILAPALTEYENKIEFPGDPMCLYTALSYPIEQVCVAKKDHDSNFIKSKSSPIGEYNDLCPAWDILPDNNYRENCKTNPSRIRVKTRLNTDQWVFDPRVWNAKTKSNLEKLLSYHKPKVILISTVSPALPYAIDISKMIKKILPESIIVLGGRHVDATTFIINNKVSFNKSSVVHAIKKSIIPQVFDFAIAREGYYALDFLMKMISLSMDIYTKQTSVTNVLAVMKHNSEKLKNIKGHSAITAFHNDDLSSFVISGSNTKLSDLPSPYKPFSIRAKFPIFKDSENNQLLTAHINTSHACPFSCHFCSESSKVVGQLLSFDNKKELYKSLILENLSYGAESFFFDDSVLCAGDIKKIHTLLDSFIELKNLSSSNTSKLNQGIKNRLNKLQWGAQFTVDFLVIIHDAQTIKQLLIKMKKAGCNYIYIGLESLSTQVIDKVQKNLQRKGDWLNKVRQALTMLHDAEIRVGTSLLFGLPGETMDSINETIDRVSNFINQNLIYIASPNIVTYHPNTELSIIDGVAGSLNYFKLPNKVSPPYSFFEEAFSEWVPKRITEQMIWQIHNKTNSLWKEGRNNNLMNPSLEN